jgi:hypothetical protein
MLARQVASLRVQATAHHSHELLVLIANGILSCNCRLGSSSPTRTRATPQQAGRTSKQRLTSRGITFSSEWLCLACCMLVPARLHRHPASSKPADAGKHADGRTAADWLRCSYLLYVIAAVYVIAMTGLRRLGPWELGLNLLALMWATLIALSIWPPVEAVLPRKETEVGWKICWDVGGSCPCVCKAVAWTVAGSSPCPLLLSAVVQLLWQGGQWLCLRYSPSCRSWLRSLQRWQPALHRL